jgi:hypothetical protein
VKRVPLVWHTLRWPREIDAEALSEIIRLLATTAGSPMILEAVGRSGAVEHRLAVPEGRHDNVSHHLRAALPGIGVDELASRPTLLVKRAVELRLSSAHRPLRTVDPATVSHSVLGALSDLKAGETLSLVWVLGPTLLPIAVPNRVEQISGNSWIKDIALTAVGKQITVDADARNALKAKQAEPGWKAAGRIGVTAASASRQRQLVRQVLGALRSTEAPGVAFWVRSRHPSTVAGARVPWRFPLRLNATEVASLSGWPASATAQLPVARQRSRLLPPSPAIPARGRIVGESTFPGRERPLAIGATDSLRHTYVLGPSGVGKSTVLARSIADDMVAGRAVVVVEPKADLIRDVLAHVPTDRVKDVVLVDPNDANGTVGINPLSGGGTNPELVADQLLAVFKGLYGASFGPRTTDIAGAALHTLARVPNMTLAGLPLILTDSGFRRRCLAHLDDPIALGPFWAAFENWSDAARTEAVAPLLNKTRPFLLRANLRAVLGQSHPKFNVLDVFTKRRILLVDCSKGALGPETSALLASLVISVVWGATLQRSSIPAERRHPVSVYLDEFQDFLRLPTDLGDALAQARGLGVGFTLANQYLHQLDAPMRSAVLANAQNKVCFRLADEDARAMATKGSGLEAEDFASLGAYECYMQLVAGGTVQPWCSARSLPPAPETSDPDAVRAASRATYGRARAEVEAEIRSLASPHRGSAGDDLGPRRRHRGGAE